MATNAPRIYVYKITFDEVDHYYYGSHKEKKFDEYYMGSPVTHKDYWVKYTPRKEYIKFFEFSDVGYIEAEKFENDLIKPVFNADSLCLNEHCGGIMSLQVRKDSGKTGGKKSFELGLGIHGLPKEQRIEISRKAGQKTYELKTGIHARSKEKMSEDGKKGGKIGGKISYQLGIGVHGLSKEKRKETGKISGHKTYELGVGIHGLSLDQKDEARKLGAKTQHSQKWQCTVTGYVSSPCGLSSYQRSRGLDTCNRIQLK